MIPKHKVAMIGLGYVGLTTAACFASRGIRVVGIDVDKRRVTKLSKGVVPIHEEGVDTLIKRAVGSGLISFHESYEAIKSCDIFFLTVGTPGLAGGGIDTSYVDAAAEAVGRILRERRGYPVVVVKSTVTPSTTQTKILSILERESGLKCGKGFGLVTNPEFLREGKAVWDMMHPDAVVLGRVDQRSVRVIKSLYQRIYRKMPPLLVTEAINAEFLKYGVNSLRAVQLSFINTLANMCSRKEGAKVDEVIKGLIMINHIDKRYSHAGLGFGGSCLPKDTNALVSLARSLGVDEGLLSMAMSINEGQAAEAISMAESLVGSIKGRRIAVLGLTFKAGTNDTRESVGIRVAKSLVTRGAEVIAYDPAYGVDGGGGDSFKIAKSVGDCIKGTDCCVVTNEWDEFKILGPQTFRRLMKQPVIVDGRGLYDIEEFAKAKVNVRRIGVGAIPENRSRYLR